MKRKSIAAIVILAIGAGTIPALADSGHGHGNQQGAPRTGSFQHGGSGMMGGGMADMMRMMQMMHGQHAGMMGGPGSMMGNADHLRKLLDADGDGVVSSEEFRSGMTGQLTQYDADGDGSLSLAEFETMHSAHVREATVDRFQVFDADGDGIVTTDEIAAQADRMERMMRSHMAATDGSMPMMGDGGSGSMMNGNGAGTDEN